MEINRLSDCITPSREYMLSTKVAKGTIENENVKEVKNNVQCFQELCKSYPDVSFIAISDDAGTINDFYASLGACDTSHFGYPGQVSVLIPDKVIEKMAVDPEYEKRVYSDIKSLIDNYQSQTSVAFRDNMDSAAVQYIDPDDLERNHLPYMVHGWQGPMNYYINAGKQKFSFHQEMLNKFNNFNEIKYNEMLDRLFEMKK